MSVSTSFSTTLCCWSWPNKMSCRAIQCRLWPFFLSKKTKLHSVDYVSFLSKTLLYHASFIVNHHILKWIMENKFYMIQTLIGFVIILFLSMHVYHMTKENFFTGNHGFTCKIVTCSIHVKQFYSEFLCFYMNLTWNHLHMIVRWKCMWI